MTIALTTPAQISMWVLLSRRSQLHMQMRGLNVPGIVKWCRENVPGAEKARTAKACLVPLNDFIGEHGGPEDPMMNFQVLETPSLRQGLYFDQGIFSTLEEAAEKFGAQYDAGRIVVVRTLSDPREADPSIVMEKE